MKTIAHAGINSTGTHYLHDIEAGHFGLQTDEPVALGSLHVHRVLHASGALDDAQWQRLLEIVANTPVTKAMREGVDITSERGNTGA